MKTTKPFERSWIVCAVAVFCNILWGSAFPFVKRGYDYFAIDAADTAAQILFAGSRFFLAGFLVISFCSIMQKKPVIPQKEDLRKIVTLSSVQTISQYFFLYIGLAKTTAVKSSILNTTHIFLGILIACLLFHTELLTCRKICGCLLGFIGVVLINLGGKEMEFSWNTIGDTCILLSSLSNALSTTLIKKYSQKTNPALLNGYQFMFGGAVMILGASLFGGHFHNICIPGIAILIYLAFLSACAYTLWSILLKYNPVTKVSIYAFTHPVFGVILSTLILKETASFGLQGVFALLLVCIGIIVVNLETTAHSKTT